jgi:hypothetical protein
MTSFLEVLAHEDNNDALKVRQASVTAKIRSDAQFRAWIEGASSPNDQLERLAFVQDEITGIAHVAADEFGVDGGAIARSVVNSYRPTVSNTHEASIHEARLPRMCPYHKDVVNISLAQGDPKAGFEAMSQHWGGPRHCEGDGYKGESCKFKPQMTTQSFWDERKDELEQKRQQRAEREQAEAEQQAVEEQVEEAPVEEPEAREPVEETPESEGAEVIDFPSPGGGVGSEAAPEPMSMAASTAGFQSTSMGAGNDPTQWMTQRVAELTRSGIEPVAAWKQALEDYQNQHGQTVPYPAFQGLMNEHFPRGGKVATEVTGLGGPSPKMDKRKWTPQTVGEPELEGSESRFPTKRKDIVQAVRPSDEPGKNNLKEIGENKTEHQDVTREGGPAKTDQGGTWSEGPRSAVSAKLPDDVDKNPIRALMTGEYDGFLPQNVVQQAVAAHRGR